MRLLDEGDAEGWAATFTEDGSFAANAHPEPTVGRANLAAAVRRTHQELQAAGVKHRHWLGMLSVDALEDGTVRAFSYALVIATPKGGQPVIHRSTTCSDILVPNGDSWLVQRREVSRDDLV